jgi:hypothetical protein
VEKVYSSDEYKIPIRELSFSSNNDQIIKLSYKGILLFWSVAMRSSCMDGQLEIKIKMTSSLIQQLFTRNQCQSCPLITSLAAPTTSLSVMTKMSTEEEKVGGPDITIICMMAIHSEEEMEKKERVRPERSKIIKALQKGYYVQHLSYT